jgi:hypothetical protein
MKQPVSLVSIQAVSVIGMALVVVAFWFSLREPRFVNGEVQRIWRFAAIAMTLVFVLVIFGWRSLQ